MWMWIRKSSSATDRTEDHAMKALWAAALLVAGLASDTWAAEPRILRAVFVEAETGFDPAQISDLYSRTITPHIFESLYTYDHLARPYKIRPLTAAAMPEVSADFRVWTVKLKPGIHFADDPAFKGRPRELVASDYVYAFKRFYDPANKSPNYSALEDEGIAGLEELRQAALKSRQPFNYDAPVEGLVALDRYTLQFKLRQGRPRFLFALAAGDLSGAVAREVVQAYGDRIMEHPVGTGPFRLKEWRRSSLIVLERNPRFREVHYDAEPNADDAQGQAWLARFKGRRLPLVDEVHVAVIEEAQPRWLSFLNGQLDVVSVPIEFSSVALPGGRIAPNLARQGIELQRVVNADYTTTYFNMEDPLVGGYTPEKVALRRAISLGIDIGREISLIRRDQAVVAQAPMPPHTFGYDPDLKTENGDFDPARAKALLDLYGYVDRTGDGWREQPDGRPLVLEMATQPGQIDRQFNELFRKDMERIGVAVRFLNQKWPENLKAARAGKLQLWMLGSTAARPDAQEAIERMYGPSAGKANLARFQLAAFDDIYRRMLALPDGPERQALFLEASKLVVAYAPYKIHVHRVINDVTQPWVQGFRRPLFWRQLWQYIDVDEAVRHQAP
jgi:ABC-type transport system substrate-binding protein